MKKKEEENEPLSHYIIGLARFYLYLAMAATAVAFIVMVAEHQAKEDVRHDLALATPAVLPQKEKSHG